MKSVKIIVSLFDFIPLNLVHFNIMSFELPGIFEAQGMHECFRLYACLWSKIEADCNFFLIFGFSEEFSLSYLNFLDLFAQVVGMDDSSADMKSEWNPVY